jgi:tRNA (guanine-N7-)-methyltransferase
LTSPRYLEIYRELLQRSGFVRLKTDNTLLYEYTLEQLHSRSDITDLAFTADVYTSDLKKECFDIKTRYEQEFTQKGEKIKYLRFRFVQ